MAKGKGEKEYKASGPTKDNKVDTSAMKAAAAAYPAEIGSKHQIDPNMNAAAQAAAHADVYKDVSKTAGESAKKEERKSEKEEAKKQVDPYENTGYTLCLLCDYRVPQVEGAELHPLPDGTPNGNYAADAWAKKIDEASLKVFEYSGDPALPENGGLACDIIIGTDSPNSLPEDLLRDPFGMQLRNMHVAAKFYCQSWNQHRDTREGKVQKMTAAATATTVDKNPDFDNTAKAAEAASKYGPVEPKTADGDKKYIPDDDNDGYSQKDMTEFYEDQGITVQKGEDKEPVQQKGESDEDYKERHSDWSVRDTFKETDKFGKEMSDAKQQYAEDKGLGPQATQDSFIDKMKNVVDTKVGDISLADDPSMLLKDPKLLLAAGVYIPAQITDLLEAGIRDIQRLNNLQVGNACEDIPAEKSTKPKTNKKKSEEKSSGKAKKKSEEETEEYIPPFLVPRSTIDRNIVSADREVTVINRHLFDDDLWTLSPPYSPNWISPGESINVLKTETPQDVDPFRFASGKYWYFDGAEEKMAVEVPVEENREAVLGDIGGTVGIPFSIFSEQESWSSSKGLSYGRCKSSRKEYGQFVSCIYRKNKQHRKLIKRRTCTRQTNYPD